ncbi:hypothetical protein GK2143 [Geobacillus kaustophilus HTA426]|uniref:Uncharacterized protein n=1 Tax=Geobacillus kaustophilus (strain HTA426) TaxID=235909 RepID=Q5KY08_GEOKA|nr:hypothetical protein GK2143 [Geobacillus kaustophilus HTA426]
MREGNFLFGYKSRQWEYWSVLSMMSQQLSRIGQRAKSSSKWLRVAPTHRASSNRLVEEGAAGMLGCPVDDVPAAQQDRATSKVIFEMAPSCPDASGFFESACRGRGIGPKPSVGSSSLSWDATYIRFVPVKILKTLDTIAFAVVFHFLGIPKKTIGSEKILHEFCAVITGHYRVPSWFDLPAAILFVPSRL